MKSSLVMFAAQEAEQAEAAVAVSPYVLGAITLAIAIFLLLVTYAFRNVHTRH